MRRGKTVRHILTTTHPSKDVKGWEGPQSYTKSAGILLSIGAQMIARPGLRQKESLLRKVPLIQWNLSRNWPSGELRSTKRLRKPTHLPDFGEGRVVNSSLTSVVGYDDYHDGYTLRVLQALQYGRYTPDTKTATRCLIEKG